MTVGFPIIYIKIKTESKKLLNIINGDVFRHWMATKKVFFFRINVKNDTDVVS